MQKGMIKFIRAQTDSAASSQKEWHLQGKLKETNGDPGNQGKRDDVAHPESAAGDKVVEEPEAKERGSQTWSWNK